MKAIPDLQTLADREAIREVLARYCRGIDRCDLELLKSVYWPDGTDDHGSFSGNAWQFAEYVIPALSAMKQTMHQISNIVIELEGAVARCETYCVAYHLLPSDEGDVEMTVGGRYLDRLERRAGEWRIASRVYVMDWNQNGKATVRWEGGIYSGLKTRGTRYPADPSYALFV
jgi:hypothetical protein